MSPTAFLLRNRHAVWAMVLAIVVLGTVAYRQIPVRLFPDTAPPVVTVVTAWPGASASDVHRDLTDILERELASLEGVGHTASTSQDNLSRLQVEFHYGTDVRLAAVDVQNALARVAADLPAQAEAPRVQTFSTADRPIYTVGVVADDLLEARRLATDVVGPRLQAVGGVAAVDVFGGRVPGVFVEVDPLLAEAHRVSLAQIASAVQASNQSLPAGRVRGRETETLLRVDPRAEQAEDLEDRILALPDGGQLRLGTVARVVRDAEADDAWFSLDGQRAIAVQVYRSEDANTVEVVDRVRQVVSALEGELPDLTFLPGEESASFTEQSVSNLLGNVWQALALASALLFLFLGRARAALVTAFTMPLSFGLTFAVMWWLGLEFNMVTLSAVILAVGMVVDASVVVLENIVRLRDQGLPAEQAAVRGTDEVALPVLAGVATSLIVLVPLLSLPGFVGRVFGPLASTLLIALLSSVGVALVLVPILSLQLREGGRLERLAGRVSHPFQRAMDLLRRAYIRLLVFGLRRRRWVVAVAGLSFVVGVLGLRSAGMDLLPRMDGGTFTVSVETPSGSSLQQTADVVRQLEVALSRQPEVVLVQSQAGYEPGMKSTGGSGLMGPTQGFLSVTLSPRTTRDRSLWEIQDAVRQEIDAIPGIAHAVVKEVGNTAKPTTKAPLVARLTGPDPLVLDHLGDQVVAALSEVEGAVGPSRAWRRDMRRVRVVVDERQAAAIGQTPGSVALQLAAGAEGIAAGHFTPTLATPEPITVRYARGLDPQVDDHLAWPVLVPGSGEPIPLRSVVRPEPIVEQGLFASEARLPSLDILAEVDGKPLSFVVADARARLDQLVLPDGYQLALEGENKDLVESRVSLLQALAMSVFAVYLLLVAQFRSWVHPLTVMMAVPLSLSGVSLALWVAGKPVSMPVMVGLVLLVGTVVNNSILLVDVIRRRREAGVPRQQALVDGVRARFRPILMTSLSTVIGMLPLALELALGAERFSPLATAVIGGMLASTLLTLIVIPVLYDLADGLRLPRLHAGPAILTGLVLLGVGLPGLAQATELTLDQAWEQARSHPSAEAAALRADAAQARARAATGRMLPQVEMQARASQMSYVEPPRIDMPIQLPDGSTPEQVQLGELIRQQYALGVTVTQPVYAGGALRQGQKAARAGVEAAEARRTASEAEVWLRLVEAWYGHAVAEEALGLQEQVLAAAREREAQLVRRVAEGRATELERAQVALKRAEAEQRVTEARAALQVAGQVLEVWTGVPGSPARADVLGAARAATRRPLGPGVSPEVEEAEAHVRVAQAQARASRGALLPAVSLRFGAQYANPNTRYFPLEARWRDSWDASVVLTWTLDAGVRANEARGAALDAAAADASRMALQRRVDVERARAATALSSGTVQLDVADERVALAREALRSAERALAHGRTTAAEVLDREAELARAELVRQQVARELVVQAETARVLAGRYGP